jgi:gas vesicle protein
MARAYANERSQFKQPIIQHPDVRLTLDKMRAVSRGLRAICLYAAKLIDDSHDDPAAEKELSFLIPICKSYCSDQSFLLASDAVQVHGGYGFCQEYGVEQLVRDTKITAIYEGTNGIQAIDLVGRKILKDGGKTLEALSQKIATDCQSWDDSEFSKEKALLLKTLGSGQEIMKSLSTWASSGDMDTVLTHATEIQNFMARIVVSWRLGIAAQIAIEAISSASGDEKDYYQTKIDDFKTYCRYHLNLNSASLRTILY